MGGGELKKGSDTLLASTSIEIFTFLLLFHNLLSLSLALSLLNKTKYGLGLGLKHLEPQAPLQLSYPSLNNVTYLAETSPILTTIVPFPRVWYTQPPFGDVKSTSITPTKVGSSKYSMTTTNSPDPIPPSFLRP